MRGALGQPGRRAGTRSSRRREPRSLRRMTAGEFPDGAHVLRARIDMSSPNMWLRDPVLYRIRHVAHHRAGDALVRVSAVRFRARALGLHRGGDPLALHAGIRAAPAALRLAARGPRSAATRRTRPSSPGSELDYTVHEQAEAARLVNEGHVPGWDDPRMPTHRRAPAPRGIRRRRCGPSADGHRGGPVRAPDRARRARARHPQGSRLRRAAR